MNINENDVLENREDRSHRSAHNQKEDKNQTVAKKEPIIIPKFLMKFSSTYFKRASENFIPPVQNKDKIKDKIVEKSNENEKNTNSNSTFKKQQFKHKHGRSNSQYEYENRKKDGRSGGSSIYELINTKFTDNTQTTQPIFTNENCAITIPTEIDEEFGKNKLKPKISQPQIEIISFLQSNKNHEHLNQMPKIEEISKFAATDRPYLKSIGEKSNLVPQFPQLESNTLNSHDDFGAFNNLRSKSLHLIASPLLSNENYLNNNAQNAMGGDTLQVMYTPTSKHEHKTIDESKVENLDRSIVNCLICFDKAPDAVFMECGHGGILYIYILNIFKYFFIGVCYDCSLELWKNTGECFLCRHVNLN